MRAVDVLIIGGGAAGTNAAEVYRQGGGQGSVLIVTDEPHPLYSRVLLPHATKGTISPEKVFLKKPEFYPGKHIELLEGRSIDHFDGDAKTARLDDGTELSFGKALIAIGGRPRAWNIPDGNDARVLRLQTFEDIDRIHQGLRPGMPMAIVGSGFIALEFVAIAAVAKAKAVLFNRGERFWASTLGPLASAIVEQAVTAVGVGVRHCAEVEAVTEQGIRLTGGSSYECEAIGLGIGVDVPAAPFETVGAAEGILANAFLETGKTDVWAAGDCAEFEDGTIGGLRHIVGNWTNAVAQGRHVGRALLGERAPFATLTSYSSVVVPGANLIFLGETRMRPGVVREEIPGTDGKKAVEIHRLDGRVIGAIMVNCPEKRAETAALFA